MRLQPCCQGVEQLKFLVQRPILGKTRVRKPQVARVFFSIMLLMGGVLALGGTGELVSAGKYELLLGPIGLANFVHSLGNMLDYKMALQSALAQEYGTTNIAQAIKLLSDRYDAAHPLIISRPDLAINIPMNNHSPLGGVAEGGRAMRDFYLQLFHEMSRFNP